MPIYLVHGFRWPRDGFTGIRVHGIVNNLEDCSVEYIQNEQSRHDILQSFRTAFPEIMKDLEGNGRSLVLLEQYDPDDETSDQAVSQPYAFVGDRVVVMAAGPDAESSVNQLTYLDPSKQAGSPTVSAKKPKFPVPPMSKAPPFTSPATASALSVNIEDVMSEGPGVSPRAWEALADLRDKIAEGEKIGWWVVYNGDPEREFHDSEDDEDDEDDPAQLAVSSYTNAGARGSQTSNGKQHKLAHSANSAAAAETPDTPPEVPPKPAGSQLTGRAMIPPAPLPIRDKTKAILGETVPAVQEDIPEPPKLKEVAKSQGLRKKFFGRTR